MKNEYPIIILQKLNSNLPLYFAPFHLIISTTSFQYLIISTNSLKTLRCGAHLNGWLKGI